MTPKEFARPGGNLLSTGRDERLDDAAGGPREVGLDLRLTG
jgi:hypothetical protein